MIVHTFLLTTLAFLDTTQTYFIEQEFTKRGYKGKYEKNPLVRAWMNTGLTPFKYLLWTLVYISVVVWYVTVAWNIYWLALLYIIFLYFNTVHIYTVYRNRLWSDIA